MKTITLSEADLRGLLVDNNIFQQQITDLQESNNKLLAEVRELRASEKLGCQDWQQVREDDSKKAELTSEGQSALIKKADLCVKVARLMLPKISENEIEDQAVSLMFIPEDELKETHSRLQTIATATAAQKEDEDDPFPSYFGGKVVTQKTGHSKTGFIPSTDDDQDFFPDYGERSNGR